MKKIRTRYAPSPTGHLHIGGARTALFSYLYAKHFNGDFIIRIEDTDIARNVEGGEASQLENLEWLGIVADESPAKPNNAYGKYRQSEKLERYNKLIDQLLEEGKAYKAFDTVKEIQTQKEEQEARGIASFRYDKNWLTISDEEKESRATAGKYTVRLSLKPDTVYEWRDVVRGKISVNTNDVGDWVIRKQDGYPTYNFAVVVDDHDMQISHVLRGEEHITNTPKQMAVYDALGWEPPEFGHLTIITNMEGKKLSKRDASLKQFIEDYKKDGYIAHAVFNFLSLLGWTHPQAKEMMSHKELVKFFAPERLSKSPSKFDIRKMEWFSKEYMKRADNNELAKSLDLGHKSSEWKDLFIDTYKQSVPTTKDLQRAFELYKDESVKRVEKNDVVDTFAGILQAGEFTVDGIKKAITETADKTGAKGKELFMPIRLATTYQQHGPELSKAIYLFGESLVKERLGL